MDQLVIMVIPEKLEILDLMDQLVQLERLVHKVFKEILARLDPLVLLV